MIIRRAEKKDIEGIMALLSQVLEVHAKIRPDIFLPNTTKYTESELAELLADGSRRTFVAEENGRIIGHIFCEIQEQPKAANIVQFTSLYIDDLCVDKSARGGHIGKLLFERARQEAERLGCYELTLNVWEGNDGARAFYDKMGMKPKETQMELIL